MSQPGRTWLVVAAVGLLVVLVRWPSLDLPLDRDEGEYATIAQMWRQGSLPYRDVLQQKPPLVPLLYRAALAAGPDSVLSIRAMALLWQLATALALWCLLRRTAGFPGAAVGSALFAVVSGGSRIQGLTANTEGFTTLPTVLALLAITTPRPLGPDSPGRQHSRAPGGRWLAAGALLGVASLAKQPAALVAVVVPFAIERTWPARRRALAWVGAGGLLAWLPAFAYFAARGSAGAFLDSVALYNLAYAGQGTQGFWDRFEGAARALLPEHGALWLAACLGQSSRCRGSTDSAPFLWAWLAAATLGTMVSGRFYPHYFASLAAPLCCLSALWFTGACSSGWRAVGLRAVFVACVLSGWGLSYLPVWNAPTGAERSLRLFGIPHFAAAPAVAKEIRRLDPEGSTLWVWGAEAELFFLTGRRPATRFLFHYPFTGDAPPVPGGELEVLTALAAPSTRLAVVADRLDERRSLDRVLQETLRREFRVVWRDGPFLLMLRRSPRDDSTS